MDTPVSARRKAFPQDLVAVALAAWLGFVIHNLAEFGAQALLRPDTLVPTAVYVLLVIVCLLPVRRAGYWLLLGWGWLNLVGGGLLSVLPLPFLPYDPEQSATHYAMHVVYGLAQVPLLVVCTRRLRDEPHRTMSHGVRQNR
jgi:hypothetical protein